MVDHVRSIIIEYLAGRITARDLAVGLPDGWELDEGDDATARDLTLRAIGYLAEHEGGDRNDRDLREALFGLALTDLSSVSLTTERTRVQVVPQATVVTQPGYRALPAVFA
jgi:hypothetical protein